jgi:hypothetical protein
VVSTQPRLKLSEAESARSVVTPEGSDEGQLDAQSVGESQGSSSSRRMSRGALGRSSRLLSSQGRSSRLQSAQPEGKGSRSLSPPKKRHSAGSRLLTTSQGASPRMLSSSMRIIDELQLENIPAVSTQPRLKSGKAESARSVFTPSNGGDLAELPQLVENGDGVQQDVHSVAESQESTSSRRGISRGALGRSSRFLSSKGRSSRLLSAQPEGKGSRSLSPPIKRNSAVSSLPAPSTPQGGSSRRLSSSKRIIDDFKLKPFALSPDTIPVDSTQPILKLSKDESATSIVTPEGSDEGQLDAPSAGESQGGSSSRRLSRGGLGRSSRLLSSQGRSSRLLSTQPEGKGSRSLSPAKKRDSSMRIIDELQLETNSVVSTQPRLKLGKAESARSVVTPEGSDEGQLDAPSAGESQGSCSSRRLSRGALGRSSRLLSSQGRSSRLLSAQPEGKGSRSLSPAKKRDSSMRIIDELQLETNLVVSTQPRLKLGNAESARSVVTPEGSDEGSRRGIIRGALERSSRLLSSQGRSSRLLSAKEPQRPGRSRSLSPSAIKRSSRPQSMRSIISLTALPEPEIAPALAGSSGDGGTAVTRRKSRQGKKTDLFGDVNGFVQSSPKLNSSCPKLTVSGLSVTDEESDEESDDEDDEEVCDSRSATLLDPGTKKKRLQLSLHDMGASLKNKVSKPVKNYVKKKKKKTENEWSKHRG